MPIKPATPLISVIIPTYNAAGYISDAIKSVLAQNWTNCQIIVIDDGSTDQTKSEVLRFQEVIYVFQENAGPSAARNHGLRIAEGDYISFLDADDTYPQNKFSLQMTYLMQHPKTLFTSGRIKYHASDEEHMPQVSFDEIDEKSMKNWHLGACLFRKECFELVGQFNEDLRHSEDVDWWLRAVESNIPYVVIDEITLNYRLHDSNMSKDAAESQRHYLKVLKLSIDRRRKQKGGKVPDLPSIFHNSQELKPQTNNPLVSAIVTCRQPNNNLNEVLLSVYQQSYRPIEIILIGEIADTSELNSKKWMDEIINLTESRNENSINGAVQKASGHYIAFLNSRYKWTPQKLMYQVNDLEKGERDWSFTDSNKGEAGLDLSTLLISKSAIAKMELVDEKTLIRSISESVQDHQEYQLPFEFTEPLSDSI